MPSHHLPNLPDLPCVENPFDNSRPLPSTMADQRMRANMTSVLTTSLSRTAENPSQRAPIIIKGSRKKPVLSPLSSKAQRKRHVRVMWLYILSLVLVMTLALCFALPLGHDLAPDNPLMQRGSNSVVSQRSGQISIAAQATATAIFNQQNDGYGGGAARLVGNGSGSLSWPFGQCTYWANYRYHYLTSHWVSWIGNADQWVIGARAASWNVSSSPPPHVPSIIVLMPWEQGAFGVGHVAVVESIVAGVIPVTVHTSNMNFYANGGGKGIVSYYDFHVDPGKVFFIWHT